MPYSKYPGFLATLILSALIVFVAATVPGVSADGDDDILEPPPKRELTYPNLGSHLSGLAEAYEEGSASQRESAGKAAMSQGGSVAVTIYLISNVADVVQFLQDNGGDPRNVGEDYIEAYVPVSLLGAVSEQPGVIRVREIVPPQPEYGPITSQGVASHLASSWHQAGITGQEVKVGVIDLGFEGFSDLMGTELPATVVARCYTDVGIFTQDLADCEVDSDHGTAVAESLLDIAPGVSLYIAYPRSQADAINTVNWMVGQGISIINRSQSGLFEGPGDGSSPFTLSTLKLIDDAVGANIVWVNSAGNYAQSTWFGSYSDANDNGCIEFSSGGDERNTLILGEGDQVSINLRWDDKWPQTLVDPGATIDLGLYLQHSITQITVKSSNNVQSGGPAQFPYEFMRYTAPIDGYYSIFVCRLSGSIPPWIQLQVKGTSRIEHFTGHHSINNASESANRGMLAVGAAHYWDTNTIAEYSGQGPTPDGRFNPDIVGTACAQAASYELHNRGGYQCWFSGTSQAAPHVAGLAALVKQANPSFTPEQVASYLKNNAAERGTSGPDNTWGHGFAYLPPIGGCSNNPGLTADCAALLAARDTLAGTTTLNWSANAPIKTWDGVTLGGSPLRVIKLQLPNKGLTGEVPTEFGNLANLEQLGPGPSRPSWAALPICKACRYGGTS